MPALDESSTTTTTTCSICGTEYEADETVEVDSTDLCSCCAPSFLRPLARLRFTACAR